LMETFLYLVEQLQIPVLRMLIFLKFLKIIQEEWKQMIILMFY
jgi:hypothetical protein